MTVFVAVARGRMSETALACCFGAGLRETDTTGFVVTRVLNGVMARQINKGHPPLCRRAADLCYLTARAVDKFRRPFFL